MSCEINLLFHHQAHRAEFKHAGVFMLHDGMVPKKRGIVRERNDEERVRRIERY